MKRNTPTTACILALSIACLSTGSTAVCGADIDATAKKILDSTGTTGGMVVHLGCGDGQLTAALRLNDSYTVHGLDADPALVDRARSRLKVAGVYGPVSVELFNGTELPYTDNLINLVVVEHQGRVPMNEIMRVLVLGGAACVEQDGVWKKITKPWPDNIDEWTHFLHDAGNNAVADDTVVGPPRRLQWVAPPLWLRSHETPSGIQSSVSSGGRLFYIFDEGLIGVVDQRIPDRWAIICRDAFNGKLLWRRPLESWGWRAWSEEKLAGKDWLTLRGQRVNVPPENERRIVAQGDRVYTTLSYRAPMSILDATDGRTIKTVEETDGASEIMVSNGVAVVYTRQTPESVAQRRGTESSVEAALVGVDGRSGKVLWQHPCATIRPLMMAIADGRVIYLSGKELTAIDLKTGSPLWKFESEHASPRTLLCVDGVIVMQGGSRVAAHDATDGSVRWVKSGLPRVGGGEGSDLFVVDGVVWRGILSVDDDGKPVGWYPNSMVVGWDLRSGEEKKRIMVKNLISPEHHHRCYRNKATARFLINSYEGAEFLDFQGDDHGQNNWLRGACRYGMTPCNGMLYVPPDQCFCQPGSKVLGYTAVKAAPKVAWKPVADSKRLEKGPAYGQPSGASATTDPSGDWPTFRHDAARSGTTRSAVSPNVEIDWKAQLGGPLTAPVAAGGKLFVAQPDAHAVYALDASSGKQQWQFTAGGRIDSPPTIHKGLVLFGSSDGRVYCVRASDGKLAWRFLAAPLDRRVGDYGHIESAWPVHGSVLIYNDVVYFGAGRSTYLDGGIRLWGLDPVTGKILHRGLLEGPHRKVEEDRDLAFFLTGANSDVLVAEGGFLYMRQKKMTSTLQEIDVEVLSSKGAQDVGLHIFSTSGLLDDSGYNRAFWMYSKRWPGFQLANQAPKSGQLLVRDDEKTYAVRDFYRRNVHSPAFFPGTDGYLLFADLNTNEPQIVGEPGSREPIRWLPQSDYSRARGDSIRTLESRAFGLDKMIGYTRAEPTAWQTFLPVRIRGLVKAGDTLFVAGAPDEFDPDDPYAPFEARRGGRLVAVSADEGQSLTETELQSPPVFDGLIAADGRLFASLRDGTVVCLAKPNR